MTKPSPDRSTQCPLSAGSGREVAFGDAGDLDALLQAVRQGGVSVHSAFGVPVPWLCHQTGFQTPLPACCHIPQTLPGSPDQHLCLRQAGNLSQVSLDGKIITGVETTQNQRQ